tara:strand:+ start:27 stop:659 length:633 start_codon:yes stop_codon:yes gene_type:complete
MKYFNSLPFIANEDSVGDYYYLKNILIRTKLVSELSRNPMLFYKYSVQDSDTPESIAYKYYGDQYRYWLIFMANEIMDPQWDWPLTNQQFDFYIKNKYATAAGGENNVLSYTLGTVHHYEKTITTYDSDTQTTSIKTVVVDQEQYNLIQTESTTKTFANTNSSVTYTIGKSAISIYDYENDLNESKREINLINKLYISDVESQYELLVKQ